MKSPTPWKNIVMSFGFLGVALVINYYATLFAISKASNHVEDIVLSNIPTYDVGTSFVLGPFVFWFIIALFLVKTLWRVPFMLNCIAFLLLIRAGFLSITHFGIFPDHLVIERDMYGLFATGADLFFSAHTALPFMMALVFWDDIKMRYFSIASSIFFGIVVLLAHVHYSIDVAAAFFITFTIHHLAKKLFKNELAIFEQRPVRV